MSSIRRAIDALGFPKTAKKYIFCEDDEEDQVARCITIMGGLLHLLEVHFISFYERTALLNEMGRLTALFLKSQKEEAGSDDSSEPAEAICAAVNELSRNIKDKHTKTLAELSDNHDTVNHQVVMMKLSVLAKSLALLAVGNFMSNDDLVAARKSNEPPASVIKAVVTSMKRAYLAPVNDEVVNVFTMHARTQARLAIEYMVKKRNLTVS